MKKLIPLISAFLILLTSCSAPEKQTGSYLYQQTSRLESIEGKPQYLASPFVTAGDRVYIVGYQDGSFPDLGWHIPGEMGGIWDHPIKIMDGFRANITVKETNSDYCLNKADRFINYPLAGMHHFTVDNEKLEVERYQFVPDGVEGAIIEFRIINKGAEDKKIEFSFTGMTDLRPTWLGERTNMIDSEDEISFDEKLSAVIAKDKNNPWFVAFGSSLKADKYPGREISCDTVKRKGLGKNGTLMFSLDLKANEEKVIPIFIAGSYLSEESLRTNYNMLLSEGSSLISRKIERYIKTDSIARLNIPDKNIEKMYKWFRYNTDWLVRNVPEQGIGLSAGLPDYPWWFGADSYYSLQGVLATGGHELARNTIILLHNISELTNGNGRIIHEVSTNGSVYNPGNVNETAQFISILHIYFEWTGDTDFIKQLFPDVKKGIKWLTEEQDPDGNGYPNGNGMMEIRGLDTEMIDVAVYTQQALSGAAVMAKAAGEDSIAGVYQKQADALKLKINKDWWNKSAGSFGDFRGTVAEAKPILEAALIRADTMRKPLAVAELKETENHISKYAPGQRFPFVIYHNWVVNSPLETGIADPEKGLAALKTAKKYENPFGVFVTGIDKTEEPDSVVLQMRKKTFSYTGAVMTIPTGVQAVAAANYGKPEDALRYISMLSRSFSYALPGSMYEVSPDFGMMVQAWNSYGVEVPIITHFFGIKPRAYEKSVYIAPHLPTEWKGATVDDVRVGSNSISLAVSLKNDHREYRIRQTLAEWNVIVDVIGAKKVYVDNIEREMKSIEDGMLELNGSEIFIKIY
jgi:glycogen debranching enzyme